MTREEAIEYNKNLKAYMSITDKQSEYKFLEENYVALDMAIKALEKEPCEDCVSRQAVLEYIEGIEARKAIVDGLMRLPSFSIVEKLGEWLDHQNGTWIYAKCSKCESVHDVKSKYCPTCGAKMKMEGDDDLS